MNYKQNLIQKLKKELNFKKDLRTVLGQELYGPTEKEFELEEKIEELENRDQFGISRY
jgi:hypothetical protein